MARRGKRTVVRAAMGLLSVLAGGLLVLRPFTSHPLLVVTLAVGLVLAGLAEALGGSRAAPARWILGAAYLVGAAFLVGWPHLPVAAIAAVVGLLLVSTGALEIWSGMLTRTRLPAALVEPAGGGMGVALLGGIVTSMLGVGAVLWADAVLLPMPIALGARMLLVGVGLLIDLWYPPTGYGVSTQRFRIVGRVFALVLAVVLVILGIRADGGRPFPSGFYYREVAADTAAGSLLRAEGYPAGEIANGTAVRLLFATVDEHGGVVPASAVLYVPSATSGASVPLVVWAHGGAGISQGCAPSVRGEQTGGLGAVSQILAAGFAVVAPDSLGQGSPGTPSFLIGLSGAHLLLDAARAAAKVPGLRLGGAVLWGYTQGGHAAIWAGQIAAEYAPDVRVLGIAVDSPILDPAAVLAGELARPTPSALAADLLFSYSANYPDVLVADYLQPSQRLLVGEIASGCGGAGWAAQNWAAVTGIDGRWEQAPSAGPLAARLAQNLTGAISVPLLVTQDDSDPVVSKTLTDDGVARRCHAGQLVDYRIYAGGDHRSPATEGTPKLNDTLRWFADRVAGYPAANTCAPTR